MEKTESRLIQDKYEIVSKIKQGGFGIVYYGYDHVFEKPVAIKAIEPSLLKEAKWVDMFLAEAKNAAKLSHNNIVHIYNLVTAEDGQFYIVMEFVDGMDLGKILRQARKANVRLPVELSIYIIKEICKALEYAHNKRDIMTDKPLRLVHQDISPSNIMISLAGHVKLIDFGLAKFRNQNSDSDELVISGKLPYMAPEQLNVTNGHIDRRTDIFSLGVTFYEMLTGTRLLTSEDPEQIIDSLKKLRIDTSKLNENDVPAPIQKILIKMLQKSPEDRYHGANGVYLDLVEYLMSSTHAVELSEELGDFLKSLYEKNLSPEAVSVSSLKEEDSEADQQIKQLSEELEKLIQEKEDNGKGSEAHVEKESTYSKISLDDIQDVKTASVNYDAANEKPSQDSKPQSESDSQNKEKQPTQRAKDSGASLGHASSTKSDEESEINVVTENEKPNIKPEFSDETHSEQKPENDNGVAEELIPENGKSEIDVKSAEKIIAEKFRSPESQEKIHKGTTLPASTASFDEEEGEDDLKTVIDVIRLSTRTHKKAITITALSTLAFLVLFLTLDIFLQMTSLGEGIYNRLFPPAIKIITAPGGAVVYLNKERVPGETPLSIPKIEPGVHEITLTHAGFAPLVKSIHVPSKGEIKVAGEEARKGHNPYLFRFKTQIELNSEPSGAVVYLNDIQYPHRTPALVEWEVGEPLSVEMELDGFQKLSGFSLDTIEGLEEIEDRRLWEFDRIQGESKRYIVQGNFKKFINIASIPSNVTFYLDGASSPSGRTDVTKVVALSTGRHQILFRKNGFNSRRLTINVDRDGPENISVMLTRNVRFYAKDKNDPENNELGATVTKIIRNNKVYLRNEKTPCDIALPPVNLQVVLSREGYRDAVVGVSANERDVLVAMEPALIDVKIKVSDALTGLPLKDAELSFRSLTDTKAQEVMFGKTDANGMISNTLAPGEFSFRVKKAGYFEKFAILNTKKGEDTLEFKLIIQ